eukprot:scaffold19468_cov44-Prasinocladus_malaysianus.AAC.1
MSAPKASDKGHSHGEGLADVAISEQGKVFTAGADGRVVRVGGGADGEAAVVLIENDKSTALTCLALSPDGLSVAVGDKSAYVKARP